MKDVANTASKLVPIKEQPTFECSSHGEPLKVYVLMPMLRKSLLIRRK